MATVRDSTQYAAEKLGYLNKAYDRRGRMVPFYFSVTVVSAAATGDTYNLFVLPANWRVARIMVITNGLGASAGAVTCKIGTAGTDDQLVKSANVGAAEGTLSLGFSGMGYTPTVDTLIIMKLTGTMVVGQIIKGCLEAIPGA